MIRKYPAKISAAETLSRKVKSLKKLGLKECFETSQSEVTLHHQFTKDNLIEGEDYILALGVSVIDGTYSKVTVVVTLPRD